MKVRDRIKELRRVRAGDLIPNPKNWRTHPSAQADALRGLLAEIGYADALLVRETPSGLMLVDGHLRAEMTPDAEVPVLVLDVDEAEADKLLATLDPLAGMAGADADLLGELLASVQTESEAVAALLKGLAEQHPLPPTEGLTDDDAVPEAPEPITKLGDLWLLGGHRLVCGDATKAEDVGRLLDGATPRLCVTDPPYGVGYQGGASNSEQRERLRGDDATQLYGPMLALFAGEVVYSWFAGRQGGPVYEAALAAGFVPRSMIVWNKVNAHYGAAAADYKQRHEPCLYSVRKGCASRYAGPTNEPTVWDIPQPSVNELHPTQKPLECMARPIRNHDAPEVFDPFLGSGTTLIACEKLGRRCYGMEIEPRYVDVAVKRWEQFTGKEAERCPAS
jgi:DNA modification methylase